MAKKNGNSENPTENEPDEGQESTSPETPITPETPSEYIEDDFLTEPENAVFGDDFFPDLYDADLDDPYDSKHGVIQRTFDRFLDSASQEAVFGEPVILGDKMIIPAAEVVSAFGFGLGGGPVDSEGDSGGGGGGGGKIHSRPVAVIIADSNGVRVEPIIDVTKLGLAALTAFGFMATFAVKFLRNSNR